MGLISKEEIDHIRDSVDIVEVIQNYLPLTQKGKNYFGVCPFHDDKNPSMSVSRERQIYTCFSCHATGNVYKFITDYEHVGFLEAVKKVADMSGINVQIQAQVTNQHSSKLYEVYETAQKFYQNSLQTIGGKGAKEYLHNRGIDDAIIKEFGIGLSLKNRELLTKLLTKKGYEEALLLKSGLMIKNQYGLSDIYTDRIMFPLEDVNGHIVGYSGRIYDSSDGSKYINSKESEIFKKGELLYNYFRSKDECRSKNIVYIMEGFMDVIAAYQVGIKNTIAMMGTAVTKNQANFIKRMAQNVVLCFDGDDAGQKATLACSNELIKIGMIPKVVVLEGKMDPDDYIKAHGPKDFIWALENPINIMDFKIRYFKTGKNLSNSTELAQYISQMIHEIAKIDDEILKELTLKKMSEESKLELGFLKNKLNQLAEPTKQVEHKQEETRVQRDKPSLCEKAERQLIYYMLRDADVIKTYNKKITYMPTERYRLLAREISHFHKITRSMELADFITSINDREELMKTLGEIESIPMKDTYTLEQITDYIQTINHFNAEVECDRIKEQMKHETNFEKKALLGQQIIEIEKTVRGEEHV